MKIIKSAATKHTCTCTLSIVRSNIATGKLPAPNARVGFVADNDRNKWGRVCDGHSERSRQSVMMMMMATVAEDNVQLQNSCCTHHSLPSLTVA